MASSMGSDIGKMVLRISKAVDKGSADTVFRAADQAKSIQVAEINRVVGGDMKLSGVGKSGASVGVSYKKGRSGSSPEVVLKATGPLQLVENNTAGHVIRSSGAKGAGKRSSKSKKFGYQSQAFGPGLTFTGKGAINIPGVGFRRSARHPGTKGQHPWEKGRKKAEPVIAKAMRSRTFNVVKGAASP